MTGPVRARLYNAEGELIAEGACHLDERSAIATLEPERTPGVLQKQRGDLTLELDSGRTVRVSDRSMIMRFRSGAGGEGRRKVYRLRLLDSYAQEARAAGGAGEGAPAFLQDGGSLRMGGETPAAR
jgi:hypothetical protein